MENRVSRRFSDLVSSTLTPAGLIKTAAVAMLIAPLGVASAQGSCKGSKNEGTPMCNTTPAAAPFASTGWKTVAIDHFDMQAADYKKETAYYATLMNWRVRSDNGKEAVLDIGDAGTVIIHGGYTPPPPPPPRVMTAADSAAFAARGAGRAGAAGGAGRGVAARPARIPSTTLWSAIALEISPWNAKTVEAELKKRGLNPIAESDGKGYEAFHVKDPDGFDVILTNGAYAKARKANKAKPSLPVDAPFAGTNWHTVWLDHISFGVTNYKESAAWYQALLGWMPQGDEGSQNETWICDDCGNVIIRGGNPMNTSRPAPAVRSARMDHISFGIDPFDPDKTMSELESRGLTHSADTGGHGDIHDAAALYKSYHTTTPGGFNLQISNATKANRTVR
jgi:catechol 2,3-dioxygenase-like lactoylglutathione lyase family enzyme